MKIIMVFIISYLLGSIPTGYVITNWIKGIDVRKFGSGNVGATNVTRVMGLKYGAFVALMDILKGYISVLIAQNILQVTPNYIIFAAALLAIIGHDWSIFLKFSGGKGVATTAGVILRLLPYGFLVFAIIWLSIVIFTRYVSLASISGIISVPITTYYFYDSNYALFGLIVAIFIIYTHRENIKRLLEGRENRFGWPPKAKKGDK